MEKGGQEVPVTIARLCGIRAKLLLNALESAVTVAYPA